MSGITKMQFEPIEKGIHKLHNTTDFPMIGFKNALYNGEEYELAPKDTIDAGEVVITSSGTWTVPEGVKTIDIFAVGGGGGAGGDWMQIVNVNQWQAGYARSQADIVSGSSGGYGYTKTLSNVTVEPLSTLNIVIGSGGAAGKFYHITAENGTGTPMSDSTASSQSDITNGSVGGTTTVSYNNEVILSANGGQGGNKCPSYSADTATPAAGVNGGSGSGSGYVKYYLYEYSNGSSNSTTIETKAGLDGYNGGNGSGSTRTYSSSSSTSSVGSGGKGQGYTTRAFGETTNTLYASRTVTAANTGNNGKSYNNTSSSSGNDSGSRTGGAGVVIIRWPEQKI